jgi:hypothetical protein
MTRIASIRLAHTALPVALSLLALAGCGTTRSSDSLRTATEQLLISDAIDRAVQTVDFGPLSGQTVYLDDSKLEEVVDKNYLVSTLRQHLLASGCTLKNNRNDADFIVEARAGAVGTDRNDLLFGIPATNVPQLVPLQGVPTAIPEVPLAKRQDQRGIAKISMFAYHRESGRPVWQSGLASRQSSSNDVWLFGAGPFQYGSVAEKQPGAHIANSSDISTEQNAEKHADGKKVTLGQRVLFASPDKLVKQQHRRLPPAEAVAKADTKPTPTPSTTPTQPAPPTQHASTQTVIATASVPKRVDLEAARRVIPRLTGPVPGAEQQKAGSPKTVELDQPTRDPDSISLPQPRFDSL